MVSPLNALMQDQINKLRGHLNVRILEDHRYSVGQKVDGSTMTEQLKMVPPQMLFAHPEILIENKKVPLILFFRRVNKCDGYRIININYINFLYFRQLLWESPPLLKLPHCSPRRETDQSEMA